MLAADLEDPVTVHSVVRTGTRGVVLLEVLPSTSGVLGLISGMAEREAQNAQNPGNATLETESKASYWGLDSKYIKLPKVDLNLECSCFCLPECWDFRHALPCPALSLHFQMHEQK